MDRDALRPDGNIHLERIRFFVGKSCSGDLCFDARLRSYPPIHSGITTAGNIDILRDVASHQLKANQRNRYASVLGDRQIVMNNARDDGLVALNEEARN